MLKPSGILRLAIPDKRYEFDYFRDVTGLAEVINDLYQPSELQSPGMIADYFTNVVVYNGKVSWKSILPFGDKIRNISKSKYVFLHPTETVKESIVRVCDRKEYIDIHHYFLLQVRLNYWYMN